MHEIVTLQIPAGRDAAIERHRWATIKTILFTVALGRTLSMAVIVRWLGTPYSQPQSNLRSTSKISGVLVGEHACPNLWTLARATVVAVSQRPGLKSSHIWDPAHTWLHRDGPLAATVVLQKLCCGHRRQC